MMLLYLAAITATASVLCAILAVRIDMKNFKNLKNNTYERNIKA